MKEVRQVMEKKGGGNDRISKIGKIDVWQVRCDFTLRREFPLTAQNFRHALLA